MAAARIPPIQCLLAFEALSRLRSVSQAAEEMSVTPSAVSHRIKQLEMQLGVKLFTRDFGLTEDGMAYLVPVRQGLKSLQQVPGHAGVAASSATRLRLSVPPTFSRQILLPRLTRFRHAYPEIELILQVAVPLFEVRNDDVDLEIRYGAGPYSGVEQLRILSDEITPVCSPEYLHEFGPFGPFDQLEDVARARLIRTPLEPWSTWFQAHGLSLPEPREGAQFNDVGLVLDAAAAGFGVALMRMKLGLTWLDSGRLVRLSPRTVPSPHHHHLCWKAGVMERWECAAFADWMLASLA